MKKWNLWLLASLFVAALTLTACSKDDDEKKNDPKKEVKKVMGTWVSVNPEFDSWSKTVTLNDDNTFTYTYCAYAGEEYENKNIYSGNWELKNGDILVTLNTRENIYKDNDEEKEIDIQFVLNYQKYANGYLLYTTTKEIADMGDFFVREGDTPELSEDRMADHELVGGWEKGSGMFSSTYYFRADGIWRFSSGVLMPEKGWYFDLDPVKDSEGNEIKRILQITYSKADMAIYETFVTCYVIQDDQLYMAGSVESLDDLLKASPWSRKTE